MAARHSRSRPRPSRPAAPRARDSQQLSSVRIGDIRAQAPSATRRRTRSWALRSLLALLLVAFIGAGLAYAYFSDLFSIDEVRVTGVRHLTAEEMASLAAVPASSTLLRIDDDAISQRLRTNPWVEDVAVKRVFPHAIELDITERAISAVVEVTSVQDQSVESWAIARGGMWLMLIPPEGSQEAVGLSSAIYEDAASVLHITDVPLDVSPEVGTICTDESVLNALAIVSGFSTTLADQVSVVSATDTANTILTLDSGIQIAFGKAEDIREKERVCLKLMEEYPDQVSYINVRVVERPTWRAVGSW